MKTKKGYTYVDVTIKDCLSWGCLGLCDFCNEPLLMGGHLVFILNSCICPRCFKEWDPEVYPEDLALQEKEQSEWYAYHGIGGEENE